MLSFPFVLCAQTGKLSLSLPEAAEWMSRRNLTLQIADKAVDIARSERQKLNAFWYPAVNASGMYVHLSDKVEVRQPLNTYTEPAKDFVHSFLPDNPLLVNILDQLGSYTLSVPLLQRNLTTVDVSISWPIFTGGKRIYASRIGNRMVDWSELAKDETSAGLQTELVQTYYALRLAEKVVEVREQTYRNLQRHYAHARKLEVTGMITKAERLFAEVNQQEALREWETARKEYDVAHEALCSLLDIQALNVYPMSPLFIIDELPDSLYFKNLIPNTNYTIGKLRLEEVMADNRLRISRSTYLPTVALVGKQTLYAHHLPRNLMPRTMIGVGFTWNLFDGLNRETDVRTARLVKESVALGREKAESALGVLVQKLYTELQEAQTEVSTLRATLSLSEELLRIRRKSFDEGMCTSTEVVDAEVMLSQVRMAMLLAYYQFDVSLATLCSICGVPEMFWDLMKKI